MKIASCLYLIAVGLALVTPRGADAQQPSEPLKQVFTAWEKRGKAISSIRYVISGTSIIPRNTFSNSLGIHDGTSNPTTDIVQREEAVFLLDRLGSRFRLELAGEKYNLDQKKVFPYTLMALFDNKDYATAVPREQNINTVAPRLPSDPDVAIHRNYSSYYPLDTINAYFLSPLLLAHGLIPRFSVQTDFTREQDISDYFVKGWHEYEGRQCLVLRTFPDKTGIGTAVDEYWVDLSRDCAVVRQFAYVDNEIIIDLQIAYQQRHGHWLPLRWSGRSALKTDQVQNITRLEVKDLSIDPALEASQFQPEIKPGMNVLELIYETPSYLQVRPTHSQPVSKLFHVAPDGSWNEVIDGVEHKPWHWLLRVLVELTAITAAVVLLAFWIVR